MDISKKKVTIAQGAYASWKSWNILENEISPGISWNVLEFGIMSLNILGKSALLETKEKDRTLSQCLKVMDLTFTAVS